MQLLRRAIVFCVFALAYGSAQRVGGGGGGTGTHHDTETFGRCSHDCDPCVENPWYVRSGQRCGARTSKVAYFYELGIFCTAKTTIRDRGSCGVAHASVKAMPGLDVTKGDTQVLDNVSKGFRVVFSDEEGCRIEYGHLHTPLCFGTVRVKIVVATQLLAIVVGALMACIAGEVVDTDEPRKVFEQGARQLVVHARVGGPRLLSAQFFRFAQVVANIWFPMIAMLKYHPLCILSAWFLLYILPALGWAGRSLLANPELVNAPTRCSLLGLHLRQRPAAFAYVISALRPIAFVIVVAACAIAWGRLVGEPASVVALNTSAWFRVGVANVWGHLLVRIVVDTCHVFTLVHIVLSSALVLQSVLCPCKPPSRCMCLSLEEDAEMREEIDEQVAQICEVLGGPRPGDAREKVQSFGIEPETPLSIYFAVAMAIGDLGSYIWSVITFIRRARYLLAAVTAASLWETLFLLHWRGHLQRMVPAFRTTKRVGVQSNDFRALIHWDDGLAGVPALMCKVYGLSNTQLTSLLSFLTSAFFMFSSTRAMALWLVDEIDMDIGVVDKSAATSAASSPRSPPRVQSIGGSTLATSDGEEDGLCCVWQAWGGRRGWTYSDAEEEFGGSPSEMSPLSRPALTARSSLDSEREE